LIRSLAVAQIAAVFRPTISGVGAMPTRPGWSRRALLLLLPIACGDRAAPPAGDTETPQRGGTVVIAYPSDLENLNSLVASDKFTQEVNRYVLFLPLLRYTHDLSYEPALAERWELEGDTAVVFQLRRDVRWHDGRRTTAADVVFTFERARDPETGFPNADYFALWSTVTAPDSFTVRFTFAPHAEPLAGLPFLPIMPAHLLDSIPAARMRQAAFNRRPVGNGPFRFVEYRPNERWIFEANSDFPQALGGRPYLDRLVWRPMPDQTAQLTELSTGGVDMVFAPPAQDYTRVAAQPGFRGIVRPGRQYANVMWNGRRPPLNDARVRRALSFAIDVQQIIATLRSGHALPTVGPIGRFHWAFDPELQPLPFSPDSARALLLEAGITDRDGDGTVELPDGTPFQVELKIPANNQLNRDMAEMIRSNLADVGVRLTTRPVDFSTLIQDVTSPRRNFQAVLMGWESDFRINLRDLFHSAAMSGPFQIASYSNPRVDSLLDRAAVARERREAKPIYAEVQRILREEQPWTFLYDYPDLVLMRDRVRGVEMDIRGALLNVHSWWVTAPRAPVAAPAGSDSAARSRVPDSARSP
jgi:peptide/nickel transport system substrate-binding protein